MEEQFIIKTKDGTPTSITKDSDLSDTSRSIHIVTTASLPWMTGTAVNPLLRALYLQRTRSSTEAKVTLVIPWVEREEERKLLYGAESAFSNGREGRKEQEQYVRDWACDIAGMKDEGAMIRIQFYPATYQKKLGSILTLVDICSLIPPHQADIAILEEPEHLNWIALPRYEKNSASNNNLTYHDDFMPSNDIGWMQKFKHVVGIIHTNYPAYAKSYGVRGSRTLTSKTILGLSILVCRSYCHKIIKLSATLPIMASYKECTCNVHGVRSDFLRSPTTKEECHNNNTSSSMIDSATTTAPRCYFIGKILWAKGFDFLLHCEQKYYEKTGDYFSIDIYGGGPDQEKIKRAFHGVRSKANENENGHEHENDHGKNLEESGEQESQGSNEDDETSSNEEECDDEHSSESTRSKFFETLLKAMPFLIEEVNETDPHMGNEDTNEFKVSTLQTLKDGLKMMKQIPKEKFQFNLSNIPKSRYEWRKKAIPARFMGPKDHALLKFDSYKVFVNPSVTEVLCTTSAEALAMGKFVILPVHPSNEFFYQFPNCLAYNDMEEFVSHMKYAMENDPPALPEQLAWKFTWEAAMERLIDASALTETDHKRLQDSGKITKDRRKAWIHQESGRLIKGDILKSLVGGPPTEDLRWYEIEEEEDDQSQGNAILSFESSNPKALALLSFIIAILSYFLQR